MLSALLSFLGGSAFRSIWGEFASWLNKRQDHAHELQRLQLEAQLDQARHTRELERVRLQADLKVTEMRIAADASIEQAAADAFTEAMKHVQKPTGVKWVDAWNGAVRPCAATIALSIWVFSLIQAGFIPSGWDRELIGAILGFFFASRELSKRGK